MKKLIVSLVAIALCAAMAIPALASKGKVELAYVEWSSEVASTNVVKAVLEDRLGYECEIIPVSVGPMYAAVAAGDVDGMVSSWQPIQSANLERTKNELVNLGPNMVGVQSGLVVPEYVTIDSIAELKDAADKFDGEIIGIDPGAGVMQQAENAIEQYGLEDKMELIDSTGAMMTAALKDSIRRNEWVVVTGWTPHWKWGTWKLKYLKDPKGVFGDPEDGSILTLVRKGLDKDMPEVYNFLNNFKWSPDEMAEVMVSIREGMEPADAAKEYIKKHKDQVDGWLK
ncbi:glycine betaine ABC transporter substrate-binding protein [Salidesulfovibrio brasiliensis]|uniref:glycine betaine ABC transporter substrate-binding protein n=1 Tax=Salidesulfovibrio brasiliensis TaxID=221711 RepID=UPI0006D0EC00|nr:glycine betaine ABC transporter substrate-binding protein [Salidesulfovibrio brasiliensis]